AGRPAAEYAADDGRRQPHPAWEPAPEALTVRPHRVRAPGPHTGPPYPALVRDAPARRRSHPPAGPCSGAQLAPALDAGSTTGRSPYGGAAARVRAGTVRLRGGRVHRPARDRKSVV